MQKIRRDVGKKFKLTEITKVSSVHFRESEIKKGLGGKKMSADITVVPAVRDKTFQTLSVFPWPW